MVSVVSEVLDTTVVSNIFIESLKRQMLLTLIIFAKLIQLYLAPPIFVISPQSNIFREIKVWNLQNFTDSDSHAILLSQKFRQINFY